MYHNIHQATFQMVYDILASNHFKIRIPTFRCAWLSFEINELTLKGLADLPFSHTAKMRDG